MKLKGKGWEVEKRKFCGARLALQSFLAQGISYRWQKVMAVLLQTQPNLTPLISFLSS